MSTTLPSLTSTGFLQRLQKKLTAVKHPILAQTHRQLIRRSQSGHVAITHDIPNASRVVITYAVSNERQANEAETQNNESPEAALTASEIKKRVSKSAALIKRANNLVPHDEHSNFNIMLTIWRSIADTPPANRVDLLERLSPSDIEQLWQTAGKRYAASKDDVYNTLGPDFSLWDSFPEEAGEVAIYEGRAAVDRFGSFRKLFYLHPRTYELMGHVDVGWWPLGRVLYPLYFKASIDASLFPGTDELTDMQLDYVSVNKLGLEQQDIPAGLPAPKDARWPFDGGLCDYMRLVGPGVFVGRGWKQSADKPAAEGKDFLYFVLVKRY